MSIRPKDHRQRRVEDLIRMESPNRHALIRANILTCPTHVPGRASTNLSCDTCNGTGYIGGLRADIPNINILSSPYNTIYYINGDIQAGHGLRGVGGRSSFTDGDRGTELLGDAIFFYTDNQRDSNQGKIIQLNPNSFPRPDRLIRTSDQQIFTVLHDLDEYIGTSSLIRAVSLGLGFQGAGIPGTQP